MKNKTNERLSGLVSERKLKQNEILKLSEPFQDKLNIKMSASSLSQYLSGGRTPDKLRVKLLAMTLGVNEAWLLGFDVPRDIEPDPFAATSTYNYFDTGLSAGLLTEVDPFTSLNVKEISIPNILMKKYAGNKDIFITQVNGESMNRIIPDHSFIAVKAVYSKEELNDGDIVVFQEAGELSIKRFYDDPIAKVVSFSPDSTEDSFKPIIYRYEDMKNVMIVGKVVIFLVEL